MRWLAQVSHCSSQPTQWPYLRCPALPPRRSALSVQHLALRCCCISSSTAVPGRGQKWKKQIWIVTMRERFSSFLSASVGNWTSNARRGFCSSLPPSLCCRVSHWRELVGWQGWHTIESPTNPGSSPTILEAESAVNSYSERRT